MNGEVLQTQERRKSKGIFLLLWFLFCLGLGFFVCLFVFPFVCLLAYFDLFPFGGVCTAGMRENIRGLGGEQNWGA